MSLAAGNIENVRKNIQAKINIARTKLSTLRAQQPLLGQLQVGKGQLIQSFQGKRLLRGALLSNSTRASKSSSTQHQTTKVVHTGIVDTADIGHGIPATTKAAVEQEKGAYPCSAEISIEM